MPTYSETQYHHQDSIPEMDPNVAAIQKALKDLIAWFDKIDQELKTTS